MMLMFVIFIPTGRVQMELCELNGMGQMCLVIPFLSSVTIISIAQRMGCVLVIVVDISQLKSSHFLHSVKTTRQASRSIDTPPSILGDRNSL